MHTKAHNSFLEKCFKQSQALKCIFHLTMHTKLINLASRSRGYYLLLLFVVQSLSHIWLFVTLWTAAHQASLSFTVSWSLLNLMSIESMMPSNHFILCCPFSCPQSFPASGSFPVNQLFPSGGQSTKDSASALPMNIQG